MKRYLLFSGPTYYSGGGWGDFVDSFDTWTEAHTFARGQMAADSLIDWAHIIDTQDSFKRTEVSRL